jgi:hypothetical protein
MRTAARRSQRRAVPAEPASLARRRMEPDIAVEAAAVDITNGGGCAAARCR